MPLLDTLVAVLLGVGMLGERVDSSLLVGGALILASAALANLTPATPRPPLPTPEPAAEPEAPRQTA
jgi:drug/metabolite transporter (DMT)-like permease